MFLHCVTLAYAVLAAFCAMQARQAVREIRASERIRRSPHPASWDAFLRPGRDNLPHSLVFYFRAVTVAPILVVSWILGHLLALISMYIFPIDVVVETAVGVIFGLFGVEVEQIGNCGKFPTCIVANHSSNLDVYVLLLLTARNFRLPCGFVAKADVRDLPFVGKISDLLGCVFVHRESLSDRESAVKAVERKLRGKVPSSPLSGVSTEIFEPEISDRHEQSSSLVIFPEGTTTNGKFLLPFKKALLEFPGVVYQPVRLRYSNPLASFTTTPSLTHLVLLCCLDALKVTVEWQQDPNNHSETASDNAERLFRVILKDSDLQPCPEGNYRVHKLVASALKTEMEE